MAKLDPHRWKAGFAGGAARSAKNSRGGKISSPLAVGAGIVSKAKSGIVMERFIVPNAELMRSAIKRAGIGRSDVADVFQISALKIFQQAKRFDQSRNPAPWVAAIARNSAVDFLRKRNTQVKHESTSAKNLELHNRKTNDPGTILSELEEIAGRKKEFLVALNALPNDEREILQAYLELQRAGHKSIYGELGDIFGIPLGTLKDRLKRAFAKMRVSLDGKIEW
ncbi:MAG: sigma-70 family RNA polymerase sigma factor [archaeon]